MTHAPIHRGWPAIEIDGTGESVLRVRWDGAAPTVDGAIRVVVARDLWAAVRIALVVPGAGALTAVDVDHPDSFEFVEIALRREQLALVRRHGAALRLVGDGPAVHVFSEQVREPAFAPHVVVGDPDASDPIGRLLGAVESPRSLQSFGWKLGCVLDGLVDLAEATGEDRFVRRARSHLREFLDDDGVLTYHDPWGHERRGEVYGIEGLLPFAAMARLGIAPAALAAFDAYLQSARRADGAVWDHDMVSGEGMYTIAVPLAVLGRVRDDDTLLRDAVTQLRTRVRELRESNVIVLRRYADGRTTFRDWIRAWTWYLLGLARALPILRGRLDVDDLERELRTAAAEALAMRAPDGLWRTYPREPGTPPETSGSAGIAAALAIGARDGLLPPEFRDEGLVTLEALHRHIRPDGMLGGASQANKDGERLQRSPSRILSQVGLGLSAQLIAATRPRLPLR